MISEQNFNGFLAFVFFTSVPVAILLSVVIRRLYRKAITREMMAHSGLDESAFTVPEPTRPNHNSLEFDVSPLSRGTRLRLGLAGRYFLAGVAYALVTVVTMFLLNGIAFLPVRFTVVVASFVLPALIMASYVSGLRWYWTVALAVFWVWALYQIAPQSNDIIGMLVGPAVLLSILVGNPALRTTAIPLFLVAIALVVPLVFSLDLLYAVVVAGSLDFLLFFLPTSMVTGLYLVLTLLIVLAVGLALAWIVIRLIARATGGSSEFVMQHDLLWLFQSLWLIGLGWGTNGAITLTYFLAFLAYRAVLWLLRPRTSANAVNLHLRVFGQGKRQKSLARGLLLNWRQEGPVLLIGAADLATETLDAPELAAFLRRRLSDVFIDTPADLEQARTEGEQRLTDGLFPMQDYYCRDNSWRPTVLTLMSRARRVLVDMRGFEPHNEGIRYEIHALAVRVPASSIVVVAEPEALEDVKALISDVWRKVGSTSGTDRLAIKLDGAGAKKAEAS